MIAIAFILMGLNHGDTISVNPIKWPDSCSHSGGFEIGAGLCRICTVGSDRLNSSQALRILSGNTTIEEPR